MSDHVYKIVELVGSSPTSIEDAIQTAIARASSTIDNIRWFEMLELRNYGDSALIPPPASLLAQTKASSPPGKQGGD